MNRHLYTGSMPTMVSEIRLFDLPTNAGCLHLGTEKLPGHFRKHGLIGRLADLGIQVTDLGEIPAPQEPRHNRPPIRNFPLPKLIWEMTDSFLKAHFSPEFRGLVLGLGGDCSMVVGTVSAAVQAFNHDVHLLYLDGDVDSIAPDPDTCMGSAGMGLWLLTQKSEFWQGAQLSPSQITVLGNKEAPDTDVGIPFVSLEKLREIGLQKAVHDVLSSIPKEKNILVHFDADLLCEADMPAAYSPRKDGLTLQESANLLKIILADSRVRYLEFSEFVPDKDPEGLSIRALIEILISSLLAGR